jgi:hypothetical protein
VNGWPAISSVVTIEGRPREVYISASRGPLTTTSDPFLAAALLPAMRLACPLRVEGLVTSGLLDRVGRTQAMLHTWYPKDMQVVDVHVEKVDTGDDAGGKRVGSFFSGGIDSFYNALKHQDEIDDLIFIHGFDVRLDDTERRELVSGRLRSAAGELGHTLVEAATNLRALVDPYTDWNMHSHGSALGVVALALAPQFRRVYIGATHTYDDLRPHGSHPMLDALWGHQSMEIIHDGCELSRWRKAERIVANPTVRRHLRVCWRATRNEYNCGRCNGCQRVMLFLRVTGWAEQCSAFPPLELTAAALKRDEITDAYRWRSYAEILEIAEERSLDTETIATLREMLQYALDKGVGGYAPTPDERRMEAQLAGVKADLRRVSARLNDMEASLSWRLTAPLRAVGMLVRRLPHGRS